MIHPWHGSGGGDNAWCGRDDQSLLSVRFKRQLMEQMQYNLLVRWFVGFGIDNPVWGEGAWKSVRWTDFSPERQSPRPKADRGLLPFHRKDRTIKP